LVLGGTFFGLALDRAASADDGTFDDYERSVDAAHELRAAAIVAGALGGGLVVAGIVRYATRPDGRQRPAGIGVALSAGPGRIGLRGSF
jgi:hypothetical protein